MSVTERDDPGSLSLLAGVLDEITDRLQRGEPLDAQAYLDRHPHLAGPLREALAALLAARPPAAPERMGEYRLERELGRGGMGVVYLARQESLGRPVALKLLSPQASADGRFLARFRREAQAAARLHHTNIVPVFGVGEDGGVHFYAMQYIDGRGLDQVVRDRAGQAPPDGAWCRQAAGWVAQAADALAYAHAHGVLHRDIKPGNLLLEGDGKVWVADFGLARTDEDTQLTGPGDVVGTLRYLAPERLRGVADAGGDVYALGLTLYELLTLRPAFDAADRVALVRQVTDAEPPPPRRRNAAVPRDLETVVLKATARDPARRYATAAELAADLRRFLDGRPVTARRVGMVESAWRLCRRYPLLAALLAAVAALLLAVTATASVGYLWTAAALAESEAHRRLAERRLYTANARLIQDAWDAGETGRLRELLDGQAPRPGDPDLRGWEWRHFDAALARWRPLTLPGHLKSAQATTFSPDGRLLATVGNGGGVKLEDAVTGRERATLGSPAARLSVVAWSADGTRLAAGTPAGHVTVWDPRDGKELFRLRVQSKRLLSLAWSPDGRSLATGSADRTLRVWDAATARTRLTLDRLELPPTSVNWSPDGLRLACSSVGKVRVFDAATGAELPRPVVQPLAGFDPVAWSPDGRRLAAAHLQGIFLLDADTGRHLGTLRGHSMMIRSLAWHRDGARLASTSYDGTVRLWDAVEASPLRRFRAPDAPGQVTWSPDGKRLAVVPMVGPVRVWDVERLDSSRTLGTHADTVYGLAWHRDGRLATAFNGTSHAVQVWSAGRGERLLRMAGPAATGRAPLAWSPDGGRLACGAPDGSVAVWDANTGARLATLRGHTKAVNGLVFAPDGRLASASSDATVRLWDLDRKEGAEPALVLRGHTGPVSSVAFQPDGARLATGSDDRTVRVWDATTGGVLAVLQGHEGGVNAIAFHPDGRRLASGGKDHTVRVWDALTGSETQVLRGHNQWVRALAWSPDGTRLATGGLDPHVLVWDVGLGQELARLPVEPSGANALAWSHDGDRLAAGTGSIVKVWEAAPDGPP